MGLTFAWAFFLWSKKSIKLDRFSPDFFQSSCRWLLSAITSQHIQLIADANGGFHVGCWLSAFVKVYIAWFLTPTPPTRYNFGGDWGKHPKLYDAGYNFSSEAMDFMVHATKGWLCWHSNWPPTHVKGSYPEVFWNSMPASSACRLMVGKRSER